MKLKSPLVPTHVAFCIGLMSATVTLAEEERSASATPHPQYFPMPPTGNVPLPFSESVRLGDTLYVSGQIGNRPGTVTLVPGGIAAEARQALENIRGILERRGSSLDQVVKCTVFLADIQDWPAFNLVYQDYFVKNFPARSALAASGLAFGARVEVECIAFAPHKKR